MAKIIYLLVALLIFNLCFLVAEEDAEEQTPKSEKSAAVKKEKEIEYAPLQDKDVYDIKELLEPTPLVHFTFLYQVENELKEFQGVDFDVTQYRMGIGHTFDLSDALDVEIGFYYNLWQVRQNPDIGLDVVDGGEDNRTLHAMDVPIAFVFRPNDRVSVKAEVVPGLRSDLRGFNKRDVQVVGGIEVGYMIFPNLFASVGVAVDEEFEGYTLLPTGSLIWKPSYAFDVEFHYGHLGVNSPISAKANYHYKDVFSFSMFFEHEKTTFRIRRRAGFALRVEDEVEFTFTRVGVTGTWHAQPWLDFHVTVGGTIYGDLNFDNNDAQDSEIDGGSVFVLAGVNVNSRILDQ